MTRSVDALPWMDIATTALSDMTERWTVHIGDENNFEVERVKPEDYPILNGIFPSRLAALSNVLDGLDRQLDRIKMQRRKCRQMIARELTKVGKAS